MTEAEHLDAARAALEADDLLPAEALHRFIAHMAEWTMLVGRRLDSPSYVALGARWSGMLPRASGLAVGMQILAEELDAIDRQDEARARLRRLAAGQPPLAPPARVTLEELLAVDPPTWRTR